MAGIVLTVLGAFVVFRGLSYGSHRHIMRVGDMQVSADERHVIPVWVGVGAIVGGVLLLGAGVRGRRDA
jgi:hypothetical protein